MSVASATMTTEELLALPDDGVDRWLIRGELREKHPNASGQSMTIRNRFHSRVLSRICQVLCNWLYEQPLPRGAILGGEAGVRLANPECTTVGVDVVYVSADVLDRQTSDSTLVIGIPILAIEILSPSDSVEEIHEKIDEYRAASVPLIWVVDPYDRTVLVYGDEEEPVLFNKKQEITGGSHLPDFRVPVARLFE